MPHSSARAQTPRYICNDSSIDWLMLRRLNDSDAAANTATSLTPAARARSRPGRLGTSAVYRVDGRRVMPAKTSAASAICGTHFGLTKAETSIARRPAADNRSLNAILSPVATAALSFCNPSRGPTSTTVTRAGNGMAHSMRRQPPLFEFDERNAGLDQVPGLAVHSGDDPVSRSAHGQLHLHRLENDEHIPLADAIAGRRVHPNDAGGHGRRERRASRTCCRPPALALELEFEDVAVDEHPPCVAGRRDPG